MLAIWGYFLIEKKKYGLKAARRHRSSQRDNFSAFHNFAKPYFTGFLGLSVGYNCDKKCVTSNTQATYMQQNYLNSKDFRRDVFLEKRKTSLSFLDFVDCIY